MVFHQLSPWQGWLVGWFSVTSCSLRWQHGEVPTTAPNRLGPQLVLVSELQRPCLCEGENDSVHPPALCDGHVAAHV